MKEIYTAFFSILLISVFKVSGQSQDSTVYPYVLPFLGQQAQDRGMADQLQLPFGLNVNYVNAYIELEITEFNLTVGNKDFSEILNVETLNFTAVNATTNGANYRADAWVLPFLNVYGLLSNLTGGTNVTLQPTWKNADGETLIQLPEFSSNVKFSALAYGFGTTAIFGWNGYFSSIDANYSLTDTELLENQVGYLTLSSRLGYRFLLSKKSEHFFVAPYIGIMYRNFVGAKGSDGHINLSEVFPDLDQSFNDKVDEKLASNQAIIDDPATSVSERIKLQAQNQSIEKIDQRVNESGIFNTEISYHIQKELIQTVTFQFGFNLQLSKNWMVRGEYGVADSQRFLMTGVQYRFGVKKKSQR